MSFRKLTTSLHDCFLIESHIFSDERGFFRETYSSEKFGKIGIDAVFVQDNRSISKKWVLRGLHFQTRKPQAKLLHVARWSIYDIAVDLRKNSPSYGKWEGIFLSEKDEKMRFIPRGFGHGFLALEDDTELLYKCDNLYDPHFESWIIYDDSTLKIDWENILQQHEIPELLLSEKDKKHGSFKSYFDDPIF